MNLKTLKGKNKDTYFPGGDFILSSGTFPADQKGEQLLTEFMYMIKNYYYLVAGILAVVFAVTHALNGQITVLPSLNNGSITEETKTIFFYVWHIITAENLLFGIAFLSMAFDKKISRAGYGAGIIAILMVIRWIVIFSSTLFYDTSELKNIWVDSVAIAIYVSLIVMGIRSGNKRVQT